MSLSVTTTSPQAPRLATIPTKQNILSKSIVRFMIISLIFVRAVCHLIPLGRTDATELIYLQTVVLSAPLAPAYSPLSVVFSPP
jgi:hypothetical protein